MNLIGLPPSLYAAAVVVASLVSSLLSAFGPLVSQVPGLRQQDTSRNLLMRVVVGALNLAGILAVAWMGNVVLTKEMIPVLLLTAAGFGVAGGHLVYKGVQSGVQQVLATGVSVITPASPTDPSLPFNAPINFAPPAAVTITPTSSGSGNISTAASL